VQLCLNFFKHIDKFIDKKYQRIYNNLNTGVCWCLNDREVFMKSVSAFIRVLVFMLLFCLILIGCDTNPNDGNESITITVTNLPENGEAVLWLSSDNSGNSAFFQNLKAGGTTAVAGNIGSFLLKKPTSDIVSGFTDENWTEAGSFYLGVGFGKNGNQWERSWGLPDKINISNGIIIAFSDSWIYHN
jgi:hypothetical protein